MFENRCQQSKMEVNARTERSQSSIHDQICFLLKNRAGRIPETTRIVVHYNLYPNLTEIITSKHTGKKKLAQQTTLKCFKNAYNFLGVGELGGLGR